MSGKKAAPVPDSKNAVQLAGDGQGDGALPKKGGKLRLIGVAGAALLLLAGGGLVLVGKLPFIAKPVSRPSAAPQVQFVKVPELVANLDAGPDTDSYAKMAAELQVNDAAAAAAVSAQMPAIIDMFQTYLRSMHPNDLRGSDGLYRLREALLARANVVVAPAAVQNVLFTEMVVQ